MTGNATALTAKDVLAALAGRHAGDVFVAECKNGPSYGGRLLRMDAWAMAKSWARPWATVYEIKVSRSDFVQDDKWPLYLDYCNLFYFACPWGLIQPDEVGADAGLCWVTKTGSRVITKKKAPIREKQGIPEEVFRYILMARARIGSEVETERDRIGYWQEWLAEKKEKQELGYKVSEALRKHCDGLETEVRRMSRLVESYEHIQDRLRELGFDPSKPVHSWDFRDTERGLRGFLPEKIPRTARWLRDHLNTFIEACETLETRDNKPEG